MSSSVTVTRRTMASILVDKLRQDVLAGVLKPGSRLTVKELCARYDAGAIPLREALSRLSTGGFITAEDQKGFRVAEISVEDVIDIHKQRADLECLALRQSIETGDVAWESGLVATHHALAHMQSKLKGKPLASNPEWEALHERFHVQLVSACQSHWLMSFIRILIEHSSRYRHVGSYAISGAARKRDVAAEHKAILEAVLARNADRACKLLRAHYRESAKIVVELIEAAELTRVPARER
jgi:DNA-binding GntR family transcriptional regulator